MCSSDLVVIYLDNRFAVTGYMSEGKDVNGDGIYKAAMTKENPVLFCIEQGRGRKDLLQNPKKNE